MPSAHRAHAEWTLSRLNRWAEKVGPATGQLVARILQSRPHPEQRYRAVLGIMRLGGSTATPGSTPAARAPWPSAQGRPFPQEGSARTEKSVE